MVKTLVVVESPAKAKTIKKYLGAGYEVLASKGHIKDLPKKLGHRHREGLHRRRTRSSRARRRSSQELKAAAKNVDESCSRPTPTARARPSPGTSPRS